MHSLSLHSSATKNSPLDLSLEVARLEALLVERRRALGVLQESFRRFKARYTHTIGGPLAELAEIEQAIKEAEERVLGTRHAATTEEGEERAAGFGDGRRSSTMPAQNGLRKLFWAVARMFHPDHTTDEEEARRRHTIMVEASRAYEEGDVESLHTLLGDEELRSYCAGASSPTEGHDLATRLASLRDELHTVEFGLKRIKQDRLYRLKLSVDEEAQYGRDALADQAERIKRQIVKARHRLEHLT